MSGPYRAKGMSPIVSPGLHISVANFQSIRTLQRHVSTHTHAIESSMCAAVGGISTHSSDDLA